MPQSRVEIRTPISSNRETFVKNEAKPNYSVNESQGVLKSEDELAVMESRVNGTKA